VRAYWETYNLPTTIITSSNNYGPYQFPEKFIPLSITNLIEGKKIMLYGDGSNIRDWLHVQDFCEATDLILHKGRAGETYCVGGNNEISNINLAKIILKEFGRDEKAIKYVEDRKGHDFRYAIDLTKIKNELGWTPKYNFELGLQKTIDWYKENQDWWKSLKQEVIKNVTDKQ